MARRAHPLGRSALVTLVVANMIGAGVFTTSGFALGDLGAPGWVLAAWLVGGCIALCGALSYGALARLIPASGGEYLYLSRAVHPLVGFLAGWVSLLAGFTGAIAYSALTFVAYAAPTLAAPLASALASSVILLAALLHGIALRPGAAMQTVAVTLKLAAIAAFCAYALIAGDVASWPGLQADESTRAAFPIGAFALTLMWISFSYSGYNAAVYLAGEVPDGAARVPQALVIGTLITTLAYLALNAVFVLAPEPETIAFQEDIAAIAAAAIGGPNLELAVRLLIVLALFTSVSAMIMVGPRVYAKMADDGLLPAALRFQGRIPAAAIWTQAALAVIVVWIAQLRQLLSYLGFTLGLSTAATIACVYVLARRRGAGARDLPGYPWAPAVYIVCTLAFAVLAATQSPLEMAAAVATIVSGALLYAGISRLRRA